jgi:hypothetical protein
MSKNPTGMKKLLRWQNQTVISRQVSPASLLDVSAGKWRTALVDEAGMIERRWGSTTDQKW